MKRFFIRGVVFLVALYASIFPLMRLAEFAWTRDASIDPPPDFPVLARSADGRFVVVSLERGSPQSNLVLDVSDRDLQQINKDLTSRISTSRPGYSYFEVLGRYGPYTDVVLEVPAKRDFWSKSWYRIQDGAIRPQKITRYGPMMGIFVLTLACLVGVFAVRLCDRIARRPQKAPV